MAKYYGMVGFSEMVDKGFGVYSPEIVERPYYGDLVRNTRRNDTGSGVNDDLNIQNSISIVADDYAYLNCHHLQYVTYMGARWKVNSFDVERPRLVLSVGGVYNGPTPTVAPDSSEGSGS